MAFDSQKSPRQQAFSFLRFGEIKPGGWLSAQLRRDLEHGFVGHLDDLVPDLIQVDDIYGAHRLTRSARTKELGVVARESQWEVQFLWWNSETQSNWLDGMLRAALLLDQADFIEKARLRIEHLLATQDTDGYLGIYAPDLRFSFTGENGELWAQASLFRVLLGWYEATGDLRALSAVRRAVDVTLRAYPENQSHPFALKDDFAGVGHGLVFTDILDRLYQLTGEARYLAYARWLFMEYSRQPLSQDDLQVPRLLDPNRPFQAHGVHTYEHIRSLLTAVYADVDPQLDAALAACFAKLEICLTPSGGPIGDEFIAGKKADAGETGYEYCSIHELFDSYIHLMQKTGDLHWAERAEWLFWNAAQGARHPSGCGIAYLKTDNSTSMTGPLHPDDVQDENNPQIRYKYSPVHQDVAVCCVPNAGRIAPYYVKSMWLRSSGGLVAALYGDCTLHTPVNGIDVQITERSNYPFESQITFRVEPASPVEFTLSLRKPAWATHYSLDGAESIQESGLIHIRKTWVSGDQLTVRFEAGIKLHDWGSAEAFVSFGPLLFALPLEGEPRPGREYRPGFQDCYYDQAKDGAGALALPSRVSFDVVRRPFDPSRPWDALTLEGSLVDLSNGELKRVRLSPLGGSILRRVTFARSTR